MSWLPPIAIADSTCRLALADGSAILLAELLTAGASDGLAVRLSKAMSLDPALAAWCWLQAGPDSSQNIGRLVGWLSAKAPCRLAWPEVTISAGMGDIPPPPAEFAERAAAAVQVAEVAALLAELRQVDRHAAYLCALILESAAWFAASPGAEATLPDMAAAMRKRPGSAEAVIACIAEARLLVGEGRLPPGNIRLPRRHLAQRAAAARRHWSETASGADAWLPVLAARLGRLHELETNFSQRLEQEKLESLAEFAAGAGHEMNNPLAVISGRAQLFLRDEQNPERRREFALINGQALRVHEMISDLMLFARPPQPKLERVDVAALLARLVEELQDKAAQQGVALRLETASEPLLVNADPTQLLVALRAVCDNAFNAVGADGRIDLFAQRLQTEQSANDDPSTASMVSITIRDNGPGMTPEIRRHAFDPYFSGRSAGRGLGVGLSKCWRIVALHGGKVEIVASEESRGCEFVVALPAV